MVILYTLIFLIRGRISFFCSPIFDKRSQLWSQLYVAYLKSQRWRLSVKLALHHIWKPEETVCFLIKMFFFIFNFEIKINTVTKILQWNFKMKKRVKAKALMQRFLNGKLRKELRSFASTLYLNWEIFIPFFVLIFWMYNLIIFWHWILF
jgi:hypothetical protein